MVILVCNIFISGCYAGWGDLVYFDTEEYQITNVRGTIAKIPKLGSQWKIIHDFKPTEYRQAASLGLGILTGDAKTPGYTYVSTVLQLSKIVLGHGFLNNNNSQVQTVHWVPAVESTQMPRVGEWTRIEICHEKVDDKYFLSHSVGGKELGRKEVTDTNLMKLTDVRIKVGHSMEKFCQSGFIRRLVVLEKPLD